MVIQKIEGELHKLSKLVELESFISIPIGIYKHLTSTEAVIYKTLLLFKRSPSVESLTKLTGSKKKTVVQAMEKIKTIEEGQKQNVPKYLFQENILTPSESAVIDIILFKFSEKKQSLVVKNIQECISLSEIQLKRILKKFRLEGLIFKGKGIVPNVDEIIKANAKANKEIFIKKKIKNFMSKIGDIKKILTPFEFTVLQEIVNGYTTKKGISNKTKLDEQVSEGLLKVLERYKLINIDKKKITPNFNRIEEIEEEIANVADNDQMAKIRGSLIKQPSK